MSIGFPTLSQTTSNQPIVIERQARRRVQHGLHGNPWRVGVRESLLVSRSRCPDGRCLKGQGANLRGDRVGESMGSGRMRGQEGFQEAEGVF